MMNDDRCTLECHLGEVIEALRKPAALSKEMLLASDLLPLDLKEWIRDRKNGSAFSRWIQRAGYAPIEGDQKDGRWQVGRRSVRLYGRQDLTERERRTAALNLADEAF